MAAPRKPDFVVIGAAKAGTTSLHGWLARHPQVFVPAQKELHFFAAPWLRDNSKGPGDARALQDIPHDWPAYLAHYAAAGRSLAAGDVSPSYFSWWPSRDAIRAHLGDPRIILLLRDPVEKAFSQYMHLVRDGRETLGFWEGLQAEKERTAAGYGALWRYVAGAHYAEPTARFLETFGRERMRIFYFDDLVRDTPATLRSVFEFIGVDPDVSVDTSEVRNRSGAPKSKALARVLNQPLLRRAVRGLLPARLVARVGSTLTSLNTGGKPVMDPRAAAYVREAVADDGRRLAELLGRSPPWPV